MTDLSIELVGVRLGNPFVLASGIWGSCAETLVRVARAGAGAVTAKSCSLEPRAGHPNPTVLDWGPGLINAVGLSNPGAWAQRDMLIEAKERLSKLGVPLIASIFGDSREAFRRTAAIIAQANPDFIELNISCPNVDSEFGHPFALDARAAAEVTAAVRDVYDGRLLVKLSPNAPDIAHIATTVQEAGADGLTAVNTVGPGMLIDIRARCPVLANKVGGISGPAIFPIALRCVYEIARVVDIPIIATGGVTTGQQAMQMIMAGATAVGIGSALHKFGDAVFNRLTAELACLAKEEGFADLASMRGCAHD